MTEHAKPQHRLVVLVVNGGAPETDTLREALAAIPGWDVELLAYRSAEAARAELKRRDVDLVIIDGSSACQAGLEALRTIRESGDGRPVLVLTGSDHEETAVQLMMAGASDCMAKDAVSSRSLKRAITNATEQHRLSRAIEEHRRELLRRNREIRFAYHALGHELKTPLTSVREFLAIVADGLGGPVTDEQRQYLGLAMESCDQIGAYINNLLDVKRLETGKLTLQPVPAPLGQLAARLTALMAPAAREKGVRLRHEVQPGLPRVLMDESRIAQVVTNLLSNALKFTPAGGEVVLRVAEAPDRPGCVLVSVSDTGRGIARHQLDRIFDRLYQARPSDAAVQGGLGLGLSICKELVALHGGDIWVESEPGKGSTFVFTLPVHLPRGVHEAALERTRGDEEDPGDRRRQEDLAGAGHPA